MAKAGLWAVTDAEERKRGERTGLDTLVVHAVNGGRWMWGPFRGFRVGANALSVPPGEYGRRSTAARLKLKEIDGGPHKRRSMRINSMQREEPYQGLTCFGLPRRRGFPSGPFHRWCMVVVSSCREMLG